MVFCRSSFCQSLLINLRIRARCPKNVAVKFGQFPVRADHQQQPKIEWGAEKERIKHGNGASSRN